MSGAATGRRHVGARCRWFGLLVGAVAVTAAVPAPDAETRLAAGEIRASEVAIECGAAIAGPARLVTGPATPRVIFAPSVWPIPVGRHFGVDFIVCTGTGAVLPDSVRIDADMPAHKHGMNYRASVQPRGAGRYAAEGLMFHMPGRWRFTFELGSGSAVKRLSHEIEVE